MNQIRNFFKSLHPRQFLVALMAGVLLVVSTACNSNPPSSVAGKSDIYQTNPNAAVRDKSGQPGGGGGAQGQDSYYERAGGPASNIDLYDEVQKPKGGPNQYSDIDPRRDTSGLEAQVRSNIDRSQNLTRSDNNPIETVKDTLRERSIGDRARDFAEEKSRDLQQSSEDLVRGTERGSRNLQKNVENATKNLGKAAERTADRVGDRVEETARAAQRNVEAQTSRGNQS
jgi:hypothetical protein